MFSMDCLPGGEWNRWVSYWMESCQSAGCARHFRLGQGPSRQSVPCRSQTDLNPVHEDCVEHACNTIPTPLKSQETYLSSRIITTGPLSLAMPFLGRRVICPATSYPPANRRRKWPANCSLSLRPRGCRSRETSTYRIEKCHSQYTNPAQQRHGMLLVQSQVS